MNINTLKNDHRLIKTFCELAQTPSPSYKEENVAAKIAEMLSSYGVEVGKDNYGNVIAKLDATKGLENVPSLMLSSHMDVVGGSEPINIRVSEDWKYIETDKTRTLGSDDKAGGAAMIEAVAEIVEEKLPHGPIEMTFTRDEEQCMTGIKNLDVSSLKSEYAIMIDGEKLGQIDVSGAGFTNVYVDVKTFLGGHSGMDIHDKRRVSAIKLLSEFDNSIPQGVYKMGEEGTVTSINAGSCVGGSAGVYLSENFKDGLAEDEKENFCEDKIMHTIALKAPVNVIGTEACISYSIRSSEPENEEMLINQIQETISNLNDKYKDLAQFDITIDKRLDPFVKQDDESLINIIKKSGESLGIPTKANSFHAAAETHILVKKTNFYGKNFKPVIISAANLLNIHSKNEMLDWESFLIGKKWLKSIILEFAKNFN